MNTETSSTEARQLVDRLSSRLENEKRELVLFLMELAEFDARKLALELGYPSTLGCLVRELGLSESSACRRITAARLLARFPQIGRYLLASRLTLMSLVALKDVLDDSNVDALLERASGLSEPGLRQLVMGIRFGAAASPTGAHSAPELAPATPLAATVAADAVATSTDHEHLQPMTLWVGRAFLDELEAVRTLLGHAVPSGKREEVLLHVLRAQRKVLERRRYGSPKRATAPKPATTPKVPDSSRISATVRREVYDREGGSCAYVGQENRRCGSTLRLEYQHILLQAEKDFGEAHVKRKQLEGSASNALVRLGYKRAQAEQAVRLAIEHGPHGSDLNALLHESLRILAR